MTTSLGTSTLMSVVPEEGPISPSDPAQPPGNAAQLPPLRSVHTTSFPELLARIGASLLVTTYQAGKLVVVRNEAGKLKTHFRNFGAPMGCAPRRQARAGHGLANLGVPRRPRRGGEARTTRRDTTPASCPDRATSPATSRATRWPGSATNSGSSTPGSPASARWTSREADKVSGVLSLLFRSLVGPTVV